MYCPNCGNKIENTQNFCTKCGAKIETMNELQDDKNDYFINKIIVLNSTTKKILITVICIIAIILSVLGIVQYRQYQKDIEPFDIQIFDKSGNVSLNVNYDAKSHMAIIDLIFNDITVEDWLVNYFNEYYNGTSNINIDYIGSIESSKFKIIKGEHPIIKFKVNNINSKDFVKLKVSLNNSIDLEIPEVLSKDIKIQNKIKKQYFAWKKETEAKKEQERLDKEAIEIAQEIAFKNVDGQKASIDFNPRKCLFNVNGTCFGHPFFVRGLSYEECKKTQTKTGVGVCANSKDIYSATALVCGGEQNIPTENEIDLLFADLYIKNNKFDRHRINRNYIEYFRNIYWNTTSFKAKYEEDLRKDMSIAILRQISKDKRTSNYYDFIKATKFGGDNYQEITLPRYQDINAYEKPVLYVDSPNTHPFSLCVDRKVSNSAQNVEKIISKIVQQIEKEEVKETENDLF